MQSRQERRKECAAYLNSLSADTLWLRFGISRVADITRFDRIGLPVFTSTRPLGTSISISTGKALDPAFSRAGSIAEAIELDGAEHPPEDDYYRGSYRTLRPGWPIELAPKALCSIWNVDTQIAWEEVRHVRTMQTDIVPADLVWCRQLEKTPFRYWMMGSNGLSFGYNLADAIYQGVLELVERDAIALWKYRAQIRDQYPLPLHLIASEGSELAQTLALMKEASLPLPVFYNLSTGVTQVPVAHCVITEEGTGTFGGYGAALSAEMAATRALQEALQGRAVYIAGARDDIMRRLWYSCQDMAFAPQDVRSVEPVSIDVPQTLEAQLDLLYWALPEALQRHLYYRLIYEDEHCVMCRVLSMDLDVWPWADYAPRARAHAFANGN